MRRALRASLALAGAAFALGYFDIVGASCVVAAGLRLMFVSGAR